jgi:tetratricopeptide (TPR) repeat protein
MSASSAPPIIPNLDSTNLEQLKAEAIALEGSNKHEEALVRYEEVLVIQQRDLPVGHLDTHETLMSIDRCIDQLKYASIDNMDVARSGLSLEGKEAYALHEITYERQLVTHGADHPETLTTRHNMAMSLFEQKLYVEALSMFDQLLEKQTRVLPLDDPHTLMTMDSLADTLTNLERYDESLKMYEDVVPKLIRVMSEDHDDTLLAMVGMANVQYFLRRFDDSKQTATRGLLIARRVGNEARAADFVIALSDLEEVEEDEAFEGSNSIRRTD